VLIRQSAPVIGAQGTPYAAVGEWQFSLSGRDLRSDNHYVTDVEQKQRHTLGTYVINEQHAIDLSINHQFTPRFSVAGAVPFVSASWSIPSPTAPTPGTRAEQDAHGIGDVSVVARSWVLDPKGHTKGNVSLGLGMKAPTGQSDAMDMYPDSRGLNNQLRYVDQSVQPGDGGWGIIAEAQAFRIIKRLLVFGTANYLANPRDTNGTPSLVVARGGTPSPANANRLVNSVPDQYVVRAGAGIPVWKRIGASVAWRAEGLRRYDLIGRSDGFRRPGVEMFIEPGLIYSTGRSTISVNMPIAYYRNRKPDPYTGAQGDATFPNYIGLINYNVRFGGPPRRPFGPLLPPPREPSDETATAAAAIASGGVPAQSSLQPGQSSVTLTIGGMTCDHCVSAVQSALRNVTGVDQVTVTLADKRAVVAYRPEHVQIDELVKAVKRTNGMAPYNVERVTLALSITGMTCEHCVEAVQSALRSVKGVDSATVILATNTALVTFDPSHAKTSDLTAAVAKAKGMNSYRAEMQVEKSLK